MGKYQQYALLKKIEDKALYELEIDGQTRTLTGRELKNYMSTQRGKMNFSWQPGENLSNKNDNNGRNL